MTIPSEELATLIAARAFLYDLMNSTVVPRAPKSIREKAYRLLRHYPDAWKLREIYTKFGGYY